MYQSIPIYHPRANPLALDFWEKLRSNSLVCWQLKWSNAQLTSCSKSILNPTTSRLFEKLSTVNRGAMTPEPGVHTECRKNYKILLLMMLTSVLTQESNTWLDGSHWGSNCPCYEVILRQMPGICLRGWRLGGWDVWAVWELTGTLQISIKTNLHIFKFWSCVVQNHQT